MAVEKHHVSESPSLKILSLLKDGDKYGYEMIREFGKQADNTFQLKEGMLYPLLHTLEQDGYVKSYMKDAPTSRRRKYYRLTASGQKYLKRNASPSIEGGHL